MSNETSGEHYTPRDVVRLLVSLVFSEGLKTSGEMVSSGASSIPVVVVGVC